MENEKIENAFGPRPELANAESIRKEVYEPWLGSRPTIRHLYCPAFAGLELANTFSGLV